MISSLEVSPSGGGIRRPRMFSPQFFACLASLVVLLGAVEARAMQLSPSQKVEMKQHYDKATRAYDIQKYTEAVEEYQKAYEIGGDPAMLYNVAQSYRLNDQLQESLRFYRRYLQRSPNARNREDVERKIAELEKIVEERRKAAAAVPVLAPAPPPVVVPVTPLPSNPPSRADEEASSGRMIAGVVVASVGAAGLITAAITGKMAKDKGDQLSKASMKSPMETFDPSLESSGKTLNTVTIVAAIIGSAAVVTGGVLIVTGLSGGSEGHQAMVTPVVGPGIMGAAASVRF